MIRHVKFLIEMVNIFDILQHFICVLIYNISHFLKARNDFNMCIQLTGLEKQKIDNVRIECVYRN